MMETKIEIPTREIRAGDFLDQINPASLRGPRGGKYRYLGLLVQSRVVRAGLDERGRFRVVPSTGVAFTMPGNLHDLTTAVVRRKAETEAVKHLADAQLLAASESSDRATRLAAQAELERRTR